MRPLRVTYTNSTHRDARFFKLSANACVQVTMETLAFEASGDIVDGGGRFVQPGTFTVRVEGLTGRLTLRGDALREDTFVALRRDARVQ